MLPLVNVDGSFVVCLLLPLLIVISLDPLVKFVGTISAPFAVLLLLVLPLAIAKPTSHIGVTNI